MYEAPSLRPEARRAAPLAGMERVRRIADEWLRRAPERRRGAEEHSRRRLALLALVAGVSVLLLSAAPPLGAADHSRVAMAPTIDASRSMEGGAAIAATAGSEAAAARAMADDYTASRIEAFWLTQQASDSAPPAQLESSAALRALANGDIDAWVGVPDAGVSLAAAPPQGALPAGVRRDALAWSASPMAILRTDTDIGDWAALAGRTVCVAADGRTVGELAARFGAFEQLAPSMAAALLALRTGACDAAVADESLLQRLATYPEWSKFSARLAPYRSARLELLSRADLPWGQRRRLRRLVSASMLQSAGATQAKDIAFEVYMDQDAPDCH